MWLKSNDSILFQPHITHWVNWITVAIAHASVCWITISQCVLLAEQLLHLQLRMAIARILDPQQIEGSEASETTQCNVHHHSHFKIYHLKGKCVWDHPTVEIRIIWDAAILSRSLWFVSRICPVISVPISRCQLRLRKPGIHSLSWSLLDSLLVVCGSKVRTGIFWLLL